MATLLERGKKMFRRLIPQAAAETVRYEQGDVAIDRLEAVRGASEIGETTTDEVEVTFRQPDWYVAASELFTEDGRIEPRKGDRIIATLEDGTQQVYIVLPVPNGRAFEVVDERLGLFYRIHSKVEGME